MKGRIVNIDGFAKAMEESLADYVEVTTKDIKTAVKKVGDAVKDQIRDTAPKDTGAYAKSWAVKNNEETATSLSVTVYSAKKYQLTHLLEFGHAKRGGGRVKAIVHIAPAEKKGFEMLVKEVEKGVKQ